MSAGDVRIDHRGHQIFRRWFQSQPMVGFDSTPRGTEVRVAKSYIADDDPWLLSDDEDKVFRLPEHTLTRTRLWQGHYWVVFDLKGKRLQKYVIVQGPTGLSFDLAFSPGAV